MYKKIYRNMCILSVCVMILVSVISLCVCYSSFYSQFKKELISEAKIAASLIDGNSQRLASVKAMSQKMPEKRITLIDKKGIVIFDSASDDIVGQNYKNRPEIHTAMSGKIGQSERRSDLLGVKMFYCAIRLQNGEIIRTSSKISLAVPMFYALVATALVMVLLMYFLLSVVAAKLTESILKPINDLAVHGMDNNDIYEEIKPFTERITDQHEQIKKQMSKVNYQRARLETIMDNISEGLLIFDKNLAIDSANEYAIRAMGSIEHHVQYRSIADVCDNVQLLNAVKNTIKGERQNITFENNQKTYQAFLNPLVVKNVLSGGVMLIFDVSERTRLEKIRREFTANVSHELKTPLTTIHGYAQIIGSGIARPEDFIGFVNKIEKESARLINLVDDIIRLSHLDEGAKAEDKQIILLTSVCREVVESLAKKAEEKNISVAITGDKSETMGSMSQITEMIYNICDNAIKYNNDGGRVDISVSDNTVTISDTGIGIDEQYKDRIFERFFRVDKSRSKKVSGTGLGLSIVKHLAIANNVDISVNSHPGKGSDFILKF